MLFYVVHVSCYVFFLEIIPVPLRLPSPASGLNMWITWEFSGVAYSEKKRGFLNSCRLIFFPYVHTCKWRALELTRPRTWAQHAAHKHKTCVKRCRDAESRWSERTRYIDPMLCQCWSTVYDGGPTLVQHRVDVSCFAGILCFCVTQALCWSPLVWRAKLLPFGFAALY